jgi:hypothetical protein
MNIETMIKSEDYDFGVYGISWKYHKDENGTYWYKFEDVVDVIKLKWKEACKLYDEFLTDDEKFTFEDCNNDLSLFNPTKFISSSGFDRLLQHEDERNNTIRKVKLQMECKKFDENLINEVNKLQKLVNHPTLVDYKLVGESVNKIYHMESIQHGLGLDPEKEELIEDIRKEIYDYDIDAVDIVFEMKKKPEADDPEIREILYQKHKDQESTYPSWLKDILR